MLPHLILQVVFILLIMLFSLAETAIASLNDAKLTENGDKEGKSEKNNKKLSRLLKLAEQPAKYLTTLKTCIIVLSIISGTLATDFFALPLGEFLHKLLPSLNGEGCHVLAIIAILLVLSYLTLLIGITVPSKIAAKRSVGIASALYFPIITTRIIFFPFVGFLTVSSNAIVRIFGINPHAKEEVTEKEIKMMVEASAESGSIDASEQEIINNVFEFDDLSAGDIATHRTEIAFLWLDDTVEEWDEVIRDSKFSRFPICDGSVDKVVGILNAREYFTLEDKIKENVLENATRPAYFVPESAKADLLLKNMKEKKEFLAVVLDEYGGTAGLITINDLLEKLVGEFNSDDESEEETEEKIEKLDDLTYLIKGTALVSEVEEAVGIEITDIDSETFSGFMLELNGTIPEDGSVFEVETDTLILRALEIKDHMVEKAELLIKQSEDENNDDDAEDDPEKEKAETIQS